VAARDGHANFSFVYLNALAKRHGYPKDDATDAFIDAMATFSRHFRLSLRDLERAFILYGIGNIRSSAPVAAYLIALKLTNPELFNRIGANEPAAYKEAYDQLWRLNGIEQENLAIQFPLSVFIGHVSGFDRMDAKWTEILRGLGPVAAQVGGYDRYLRWLIARLDIQIDD
jgi:hypothetical protein